MTGMFAAVLVLVASGMVASDPAPDSVLPQAPPRIEFVFGGALTGADVRLYRSSGDQIGLDPAQVEATSVIQPLPHLDPDRYLVAWRVVEDSQTTSGAFEFTVDPTGRGAVTIDRSVDLDRTIIWALTSLAIVALGFLGFGLVSDQVRSAIIGAAAAATASLGAHLWAPGGLEVGRGPWSRAWLMVGLGSLAVLGTVLAWGSLRATASRSAAGAGMLLVAGGGGWAVDTVLPGTGPFLVAGLAATALAGVLWAGGLLKPAVLAAIVGAGLIGWALQAATGEAPTVVATAGEIRLEASVVPARRGVNELHLYGYRPGQGIARLEDATASAWNLTEGIGPLEVSLLRAGPHHFLTYGADFPVPGRWRVRFQTVSEDGTPLSVDLEFDAP